MLWARWIQFTSSHSFSSIHYNSPATSRSSLWVFGPKWCISQICHAFFLSLASYYPLFDRCNNMRQECKVWSCWLYIYVEVLGDESTMHFRVTVYWGYLIVLWLFYLVCILYCGCFNLFCNMWVCRCGFCNVWVCVCMGSVMCGCVCMCGFCSVWVFWQLCGRFW
jgi:hypothetical protein